ncbi:MAG: class I SAM-dependent methyltransferase [Bryobacteraceae bacterium]|nr:class I SAM-dependent methyltransferase [Bryobacteraceae bacterium]
MKQQTQGVTFREPHLSRFRELILSGAGRVDVQDASVRDGYAHEGIIDEAFLERELYRVTLHQRNICPYLSKRVTAPRQILDVGCGTGGLSVALALTFPGAKVTGIEPDERSRQAGGIRAQGYGVEIDFQGIRPNQPLQFADNQFDLVTCTSVIEFITKHEDRLRLVRDLQRVTAPGGAVLITTPNPLRPWELHSGRLFGDWRKKEGYPWAYPQWTWRELFDGWTRIPMHDRLADKLPAAVPKVMLPLVELAGPWQMLLYRRASPVSR